MYENLKMYTINIDGEWSNFDTAFLTGKTDLQKKWTVFLLHEFLGNFVKWVKPLGLQSLSTNRGQNLDHFDVFFADQSTDFPRFACRNCSTLNMKSEILPFQKIFMSVVSSVDSNKSEEKMVVWLMIDNVCDFCLNLKKSDLHQTQLTVTQAPFLKCQIKLHK